MRKSLTALLLSISLATSCSPVYTGIRHIIDNEARNLRAQGYSPLHVESCAPIALNLLMSREGEEMHVKDISKEIIENGKDYTIARNVLSFFYFPAARITFPAEIEAFLERHNYQFKKEVGKKAETLCKELLNNKKPGIVLLSQTPGLMYHWEVLPPQIFKKKEIDILDYFSKRTEIVSTYQIRIPFLKRSALFIERIKKIYLKLNK